MRSVQKQISLLLILLISSSLNVLAQNKTITGTVRDANDVVIGASVTIKGNKSLGTITDIEGTYSISVPESAQELIFSYVGYETQIVPIKGRTTINITLSESSQMLDEVVAIGYAKVQRKDLTGAISSVGGKELANVPVTTAMQALQGKAAGVNIVTASGAPGASANITIRGGMSLTQGTEPLYIVDGFEMGDALDNIDINDIESIDVLKDASSTAIYGARGSNGIIVITTKSGKKGKTQISYNTYFSFDKLAKKLDMLNNVEEYVKYQYEFAAMRENALTAYSNVYDNAIGIDQDDFYTGAYERIANRYSGTEGINWQEEVFGGSAMTQSHNVNISTGTEKTQVMLSYNYNGQDGLLANHSSNKSSFRAKINSELYKGIRLDVNTMFSNKSTDGGGKYDGMRNVLLQPIHGGTLFTQDELLYTQTYPDYTSMDSAFNTPNPLVQNNASTSNSRSRLFSVNAGIEFDFLKYFTYRVAGSYTWSNSKSTSFADENSTSYIMDPENTGINGSIGNKESYKYQITNTLNYNQTFAQKHKVNVLLGHEVTYSESEKNSMKLRKFPYPNHGLDQIDQAEVYEKDAGHSHSGMVSAFIRANYTFDERYLFTATLRGDGSSKFAPANKWGIFPSVSAAWRISEEAFMEPVKETISNLKLRASYGFTGNTEIGVYESLATLGTSNWILGNQLVSGFFPNKIPNPDLKWERTGQFDIGLDLGLFNNRVRITTDYYKKKTTDLLYSVAVPATSGYQTMLKNIGSIENQGYELSIESDNLTGPFSWTTAFNISFNRNKVLELGGEDYKEMAEGDGHIKTGSVRRLIAGEPIGVFYGYRFDGIFQNEEECKQQTSSASPIGVGLRRYKDLNGDGKVDAANDREILGDANPKFFGGLTNTFAYKGFELNVFLQYSYGNKILNYNAMELENPTGGQNAYADMVNRWTPENPSNIYPKATTNRAILASDRFIEDGSYLKLKTLSLSYSFPKINMKHIQGLRLYVTGQNLLTWTKYRGYDPEVSYRGASTLEAGEDFGGYPQSRTFMFGVKLDIK